MSPDLSKGRTVPESTMAMVLAVVKKGGPKAASAAYRRLNPQDWASRLAKAAFAGQPRPRPRWRLARTLRRGGMLEGLAAAVAENGDWVGHHIFDDLDAGLGRNWRWRWLGADERHRRTHQLVRRVLAEFVAALDPSRAVAITYHATQVGLTGIDNKIEAQGAVLDEAVADRTAGEAEGRLARLRARLVDLPEVARPTIEAALRENPDDIEDVVTAIRDPHTPPGESLRDYIDQPPAWLGDREVPRRPVVWSVLGELAAAYGESRLASVAFDNAARAGGGGRRGYWLARAAWHAFLDDDRDRAVGLLAVTGTPEQSPEPLVRVMAALNGLAPNTVPMGVSPADAGPLALVAVTQDSRDQADGEPWMAVRRELALWNCTHPADRDVQARMAVQVEITDPTRTLPQCCTAALAVLDHTLSAGWIDDTALLTARALCWRAQVGGTADRARDLARAEQLAVTVRDHYRAVRRDTRVATREAVMAAALAGKVRRVIELGSARFGEATLEEAHDPETVRRVIEVAMFHDPAVAQAIVDDPTQLPEGFVRQWAHATVATHPAATSNLTQRQRIVLWQEVFDAASTDDQRWQALTGLADVGADDLPHVNDLAVGAPWMAAQLRARSALVRGDARAAIGLVREYRDTAVPAAVMLADAYVLLGELDAAVDTLTVAADRFDVDDLVVQAATLRARAGQMARAEKLLTTVLRTAAGDWAGRARALAVLGEVQTARGAWEEAIASWTASLEIDPRAEQLRWQLAGAHARRGEHDAAWSVLTADPDPAGGVRIPADPPTAAAAHLLLVLLHLRGKVATLARLGVEFLEKFREDTKSAGRMLTLLVNATSGDRADNLDPALQSRLRSAISTAVSTDAGSTGPQRITGTPTELLAQMTELARPDPQHVRDMQELMLQVTRGLIPLGAVTTAAGRSYAQGVVEHVAGVLCAVGDQAEHVAGVTDALVVLGIRPTRTLSTATPVTTGTDTGLGDTGPRLLSAAAVPIAEVVTDAATLFVRDMLPDIDATLVAGIREITLADDAYIDLITARDRLSMDTEGSLHVDPQTGQAAIQVIEPRIRNLRRNSINSMIALAASCRRRSAPAHSHPDLDALQVQGATAWMAGLHLAVARRAALWADDVALRHLARSVDVPTFSTAALVDAYAQVGRLTSAERDAAVDSMVRGNVGDFAPNRYRARKLAAEQGDSRVAVLSAIAKPAFWSDLDAAWDVYRSLVADVHTAAPAVVADLVYVSVLGICRTGLPDAQAVKVAAHVLAEAMITVGAMGDIPKLLLASRLASANAERTLPDLLPSAAIEALTTYEQTVPPALAADQLRALVARCSEDDAATVRRVILDRP